MRKIQAKKIKEAVSRLCMEANFKLRPDIFKQLKYAFTIETNRRAKNILKAIIDNAKIAQKEKLAICQDTGMPVVFVELGQGVNIYGGQLYDAINKGVEAGYKKGYLRNSVVKDPILRGKSGYIPSVIHVDIVKGTRVRISVLPKGFGCENKGSVQMFNPTAGIFKIKEFVLEVVKKAGPDACPPFVVGIGIGGTQDYACFLAKKALLRKIDKPGALEKEILTQINKLNIGPMGLGGKTTALAVNIEKYPTHIAGLPVCVNISCHATRSSSVII